MSLKRKIFNIFAAVVMIFGTMPMSFLSAYAEDETGIQPAEENIPKSLKSVKANGDGTYDITLEIEGVSSQKNEATKANVVVVLDTSGSMDLPTVMTQNSTGRYGIVNGDYSNLYRASGGRCVSINNDTTNTAYSDSGCDTRYDGTRYAGSGSTRLEVAKDAVNDLADKLLSQNDASDDTFKDVVEMAFVDFSTNIKNSTTHTDHTTSLSTFQGWVNAVSATGGTNWETALTKADSISFSDNDKTYIIFVSDGNPTYRDSQYGAGYYDTDGCRSDHRENFDTQCSVWGSGVSDPSPYRNFNTAKNAANLIINNANKELDDVGAFGNVDNMVNLGGTYHDASDKTALVAAFNDIVDKITKGLSVADLQIIDGVTSATSTEVDGTAGNFRYDVPDSWKDEENPFNPATFTNGSVVWNPGEHKTLSNGEKASVTFTVWPSQEAMDCIASLRNDGTCDESDLTKFGLGVHDDGSFYLITNSIATFRFRTATKNEDTGETTYSEISVPIDFEEERDPTNLPETTLNVVKTWLDSMDAGQRGDISEVSVDLFVDRESGTDPERHYAFTKDNESGNEWVGEDEYGATDYTVAPGVMKKLTAETEELRSLGPVVQVGSDEYVILESGHDYEFDNENVTLSEGGSDHYHITKYKYHPMIIGEGGNIHNVVFSEDGKTAVIEDGVLTKLSLENTLNGGILVGKTVINNGSEDTTIEDEYEITITLSEETGIYRIYTYNPDGTVKERSDKKTYTGGVINEKITVNQKIRVQDVPTGTTYEVTEVLPDGYTRNKVDYTVVMYDGTEDKDGVQEVFGNASAQATVTNYLESGDLIISKKVTATSGDLDQARNQEFSFTINFYKAQGDEEPVRTDTETCKAVKHNGTCTIKNIPKGWYYEIVEAAKAGFNSGAETTKTGTIVKGDNKAEFTNDYAVTPVDAEIVAHKAFAQGYQQFWIGSDSFELQLIGDNEIIDSQNATLSGSEVKFKRKYTNPGTYNYVITEKTQNADGSSAFRQGVHRVADDADIEVTVVVEDNGEGALVIKSITYKKTDQTIYNIYEDTKTYGANKELEFTKVLEGRDWRSTDEFTFKITGSDGAPMPKTKEYTVKNSTTGHKIDFGKIAFTEQDAGNTYVYTVSEEFDVPSVEAKDGKDSITFTVEVVFDEEEGTLNLVVSDYDNTFTNVYKTVNLTATKVWDDDENRDGLREEVFEDFYVAVKNDEGEFVDYQALDLMLEDHADKYYEFADLPEKNAEGETIQYEIVEAYGCSGKEDGAIECTEYEPEEDDPYTVTIEDGVITNSHEPELYNITGDLTVKKIWVGDGTPATVLVDLLADGEVIDTASIVKGQNNEWTWTFRNLYKYDDGEEIVYSVQESAIGENAFGDNESVIVILNDEGAIEGSWTKSEDNEKFEVTNTWKEAEDKVVYEGDTQFTIKKVDEDYKPLSDVVFAVEGHSDKTTNKNGEIIITVPISKDGKEESFEYIISEKEAKEGYDLVDGSATVTISCTSELTDRDTDNLINTYTKICTFSEEGDNGFNWDEEDLTLTVIDKRSMAKSLVIRKTFSGVNVEILKDVTFTITGPEDFGEDGEMTLTVGEDCTLSDSEIVCKVNGKIPTGEYTVEEDNAEIENFTLEVSGDNGKTKDVEKDARVEFKINNEYTAYETMYSVVKVWDDEHDYDGKRPGSLTVKLSADGEVIDTIEMTMDDAVIIGEEEEDYTTGDVWVYTWEELPYVDEYAKVINYSAEEFLESDDYEQTDTEGDEYYVLFVNTHELDDPCASGEGCGGGGPVEAPETGELTNVSRDGGVYDAGVNSMIGGFMIIVMSGMMVIFSAIRRKSEEKK